MSKPKAKAKPQPQIKPQPGAPVNPVPPSPDGSFRPVDVPLAQPAKDLGRKSTLPPRPMLRQTITIALPGDIRSDGECVTLETVAVADIMAINDMGGVGQADPYINLPHDFTEAGWIFREWGDLAVGVRVID